MSEFYGSKSVQSVPGSPLSAGPGQQAVQRSPSRVSVGLAVLAAVGMCSAFAAVASANTPRAAGIGYLCFTLVFFGCAAAFRVRARFAQGTLRIRWLLIAAASLAASIGYEPSFSQAILHTAPARLQQTACFNASEALCMLSAVLFFAGVARSIVIVDMLQALLFVFLRFNLIYSPGNLDHFATNHLVVGTIVAFLMFLVATVACLGAASRDELNFLRTLSVFFGLRLIGEFLSNQVSYSWLHYTNCSLWDLPGIALLAGFAVYLRFSSRHAPAAQPVTDRLDMAPQPSPSMLVRSLMPSFLALVNLVLGLFLLRISVRLAVVAISGSLVCYVVRTVMLHAQAMKDHALLQSRNEQLEGLAVRDHLTGIGNRRSLAGIYGHLHALAPLTGVSLMVMDIDHFKLANDHHGHPYGDQVLIALARRLEALAATIPGSHCARLGGDEFALLLPGVTLQAASVQGERLRILFSDNSSEEDSGVSLSAGVASLHAVRDMPLESLVSYADEALYRAKLLGRNRVEVQPVWDPGIGAAPTTSALLLKTQESAS
ncbi:MAG TPA: GGDEF domain-containing protein [Acidobacteriaceae bacterium]|nr:GGDEF domain-containing protein [Acidobacteriaceae bacterium]